MWGFPVCIRKIIYSYLTHLDKSVVIGLTFSQAVIFVLLLFHSGSDSKECACKAGDQGLILGLERYPRERNGYPPQYSCLGNPMGQGSWWATVHGVTESGMTGRLRMRARQLAPSLGLHQCASLSGTKDISLLPIRTPDWCN